ncbi:EpsG family protein [Photobacterium leiognathi]|uniref:EpsG family protein n=1 Tax=Photobacterium leiognathi TaxID=553611 RepID=UPI0029812EF3|nr:EpsG family protein [Photobacterium leiognathi]
MVSNKIKLLIAISIIISIILSIISANRNDNYFERNDTFAYKQQYTCLSLNNSSENCKQYIGSSKIEFGYDYTVELLSWFLGKDGFLFYKLIIALFINLTIFLCVGKLSGWNIVAIAVLLLDYRFYGFTNNTLRHGFALSLAMVSIYCSAKNKIKSSFLFYCASLGFHISALSLFPFVKRKIKMKVFIAIFAVLLFFSNYFSIFIIDNKNLVELYLPKLLKYLNRDLSTGVLFPTGYLVVYLIGAYHYIKTNNSYLILIFNVISIVIFFGLIFSSINMMGRFISFLPPLMSILVGIIWYEIKNKHKRFLFMTIVLCLWSITFIRNLDVTLSFYSVG